MSVIAIATYSCVTVCFKLQTRTRASHFGRWHTVIVISPPTLDADDDGAGSGISESPEMPPPAHASSSQLLIFFGDAVKTKSNPIIHDWPGLLSASWS